MKRLSLFTLILLLASCLALPSPALGNVGGPTSYITPSLPDQVRQPSFNVGYSATNAGSDPLGYVELWYRYTTDLCTYTPWTLWARDYSCAGGYHCGATFAFTAPSQGRYEFYTKAYGQSGSPEAKSTADDDTLVDYSDPIIGWPTNPADGAVVSGTVNVGTYFNDSWGLEAIMVYALGTPQIWIWTPPCAPAATSAQALPSLPSWVRFNLKGRPPQQSAPKVHGTTLARPGQHPQPGDVSLLGMAGLPGGTYSFLWDTAIAPDGPAPIWFWAKDLAGNEAMTAITVVVNNGTARVPQLLGATATAAAATSTSSSDRQVTFVGLAPPPTSPVGGQCALCHARPQTGKRLPPSHPGRWGAPTLSEDVSGVTLWVEAMVEGAGGFAQEAEGISIGPDYRWAYSLPLPEGDYVASFRTRASNGAFSPWMTFAFNPANLPANLTLLTQGYDGYTGAADTFLNLWEPAANFGWEKLLKVRSYDAKKGLVRFDLAPVDGVSAGQVTRAALVLWTEGQTNPQPMELRAYPAMAAWDALSATWLEAAAGVPWTLPGASAVPDDHLLEPTATALLSPSTWAMLDATDFVKGWLDGSLPNEGFLLVGMSQGAVRYTLGTSLHTQPGFRPILVVEWNP